MRAPQDQPSDDMIRAARSGRLTPVISDHFALSWLMDPDALAPAWNKLAGYGGRAADRTVAAQYASIMNGENYAVSEYTAFLKQAFIQWLQNNTSIDPHLIDKLTGEAPQLTLSQIASMAGYPESVSERPDSFRLLARLNLPLYITTSYHGFMEEALSKEGKDPQPAISYWRDEIVGEPASVFDSDPGYVPDEQRPLVYHLLGWEQEPTSMVLTEDHHLQFLKRLAGDAEVIAARVHQAIAENSLLLLGYRHRDWEFRTLFRILRGYSGGRRRDRNLAVQHMPMTDGDHDGQQIITFLERYFDEADITVYWGESDEFLRELLERL